MSIRQRLRSSSSTSKEQTTSPSKTENCNGECNLCHQQFDKQGSVLLCCALCSRQFHPECSGMDSEKISNIYSKGFQNWFCKKCRLCLFCKKKKLKASNFDCEIVSSLKDYIRKNGYTGASKMICCSECDSNFHSFCYYSLVSEQNNEEREFNSKIQPNENFVCNECKQEKVDFNEDSTLDSLLSYYSDTTEIYDSDDDINQSKINFKNISTKIVGSNIEQRRLTRSIAKRTEIKTDSILNECETSKKESLDKVKSINKTTNDCHSLTPELEISRKSIKQNNQRHLKDKQKESNGQNIISPDGSFIKRKNILKRQHIKLKDEEDLSNFNLNSHDVSFDNHKTNSEFIDENYRKSHKICNNNQKRRKDSNQTYPLRNEENHKVSSLMMAVKLREKEISSDLTNKSNYHTDSIDDEMNISSESQNSSDDLKLEEAFCTVAGCDSQGHLSGCLKTHKIIETCPLFHNQSVEECVNRYKKRLQNQQKLLEKQKLKKRSLNSPHKSKRFSLLEDNSSWNSIMEKRRIELTENAKNNLGNQIQMMTSSRQPSLSGFTPSFDLELFLEAQSQTAELINKNSVLELETNSTCSENKFPLNQTSVRSIQFGKFEIGVWYSSPYSEEFQSCLKLFICEFCLKCMNSSIILQRHLNKCSLKHPPGDEIYRKDNISFFEIDGNLQKEYCQNLCLLAKLFLDYKTLFFDVEPFLFYIMTEYDSEGMHIVGYFSKEKRSINNYNVSCILTLPQYQRSGYGRMLIEFSYLLTKTENKVGSPERPLSDLGLISYRSYWKYTIMDYLSTYEGKDISLKDISQQTGINSNDIVSTLQLMGLLKYWKGNHLILVPAELKNQFLIEAKKKRKLYANKVIDPKCLFWTPKNYNIFVK